MPYPFNRGGIVEAIAQFFGIKGSFTQDLLPSTQMVVNIADLDDSPYLRYAIPVGRGVTAPAVALEFSVAGVVAGPTTILQITQIEVQNTGAAPLDILVATITGSENATAGTTAGAKLLDLSDAGPNGAAQPLRPSGTFLGSHTAQVGAGIGRFTIPADSSRTIVFPKPGVLLRGDATSQASGGRLGVWGDVVNTGLEISFYGREWPQAG